MEIIFLKPVFKDYMWGGTRLKAEFNKKTPYEFTAESWEISTNKNGKSIITNGEFKGKSLEEIFQKRELRKSIFGNKCIGLEKFPLLIKFIDAKKDLSVQVHPDDEYAKQNENDLGKTELWYVLDCNENAKIVYGLKENIKKSQLKEIIKNGKIKQYLNYIEIEKGDSIYVPAGTIHAILSGCLICEIQQNCNLTYRVYDWDRVDEYGKERTLNIEKAIDVINLENRIEKIKLNNNSFQNIISSKYFSVDRIEVNGKKNFISSIETFYAITVIDGKGTICANEKNYEINKGDSFVIPSELGKYRICGKLSLLNSYI